MGWISFTQVANSKLVLSSNTQHTSKKDIAGQSVSLNILLNNGQGKERSLTITGSRSTLAPTRWVHSTMSASIVKSLVGIKKAGSTPDLTSKSKWVGEPDKYKAPYGAKNYKNPCIV